MFRTGLVALALLLFGVTAQAIASDATLYSETGEKISVHDIKFFKNRSNTRGFVEKALQRGCANEMAIAITPPFAPSYSYTAYCGERSRERALDKCNNWVTKRLTTRDWPITSKNGFQCDVAVQNMRILNARALNDAQRYVRVSLHILEKGKGPEILDGLLGYEVNDLVKQEFTIYNQDRTAVCEGHVDVAMGRYGSIIGTCFGNEPIRNGKFTINCGYGGACERHMVGNMSVSDTLIGIVSYISKRETEKFYPEFPQKFSLIDGSEPDQNFD
jgi:hypothetical protein